MNTYNRIKNPGFYLQRDNGYKLAVAYSLTMTELNNLRNAIAHLLQDQDCTCWGCEQGWTDDDGKPVHDCPEHGKFQTICYGCEAVEESIDHEND